MCDGQTNVMRVTPSAMYGPDTRAAERPRAVVIRGGTVPSARSVDMQMDRYSLLSVVTLRQDMGTAAGTDAASLVTTGASLVAIHNWTFLLGQTLMPGVNALLLGYLMYRSRLVPRVIPVLGLIGAPLLITATIATLFGLNEQVSVWSAISTLPVAGWELSLGVWLVVKGFKPSPITAGMVAAGTSPAY